MIFRPHKHASLSSRQSYWFMSASIVLPCILNVLASLQKRLFLIDEGKSHQRCLGATVTM